jgi:hypothetical protein
MRELKNVHDINGSPSDGNVGGERRMLLRGKGVQISKDIDISRVICT